MKTLYSSALILLASAVFSPLSAPVLATEQAAKHAAMGSMGSMNMHQQLTDGLVKKVNKAAGAVTIAHGALPNGMPGMTMAFRVKNAAWLDQLKPGQKIRFALENMQGVMIITHYELAN